jgi:hypothetical protein
MHKEGNHTPPPTTTTTSTSTMLPNIGHAPAVSAPPLAWRSPCDRTPAATPPGQRACPPAGPSTTRSPHALPPGQPAQACAHTRICMHNSMEGLLYLSLSRARTHTGRGAQGTHMHTHAHTTHAHATHAHTTHAHATHTHTNTYTHKYIHTGRRA